MLRENNFNIDTALNGNSTYTFKTEYGMFINNSITICNYFFESIFNHGKLLLLEGKLFISKFFLFLINSVIEEIKTHAEKLGYLKYNRATVRVD